MMIGAFAWLHDGAETGTRIAYGKIDRTRAGHESFVASENLFQWS
jgi:hypothetical protein